MLKPEKFDIGMTEPSGVTGNELCCVVYIALAAAVWKRTHCSCNQYLLFQTASTIYSWYLSTKTTNVFLFSLLVRHLTLEDWSKCNVLPTTPCTIKVSASLAPFLIQNRPAQVRKLERPNWPTRICGGLQNRFDFVVAKKEFWNDN